LKTVGLNLFNRCKYCFSPIVKISVNRVCLNFQSGPQTLLKLPTWTIYWICCCNLKQAWVFFLKNWRVINVKMFNSWQIWSLKTKKAIEGMIFCFLSSKSWLKKMEKLKLITWTENSYVLTLLKETDHFLNKNTKFPKKS